MKRLFIIVLFLSGCVTTIEVPAPKQFDCSATYEGHWYCKSRATNYCIDNVRIPCEDVPVEIPIGP